MRLYLTLSPSAQLVPFNHQPKITGAIHKWLGENEVHDATSLYFFSWLQGGRGTKSGISFQQGASFFISCVEEEMVAGKSFVVQLN